MHEDTNQISEIVDFIKELVAEETNCTIEEIGITESFHSLGLDSVTAVFLLEKLENKYNLSLSPILFWDYPTIKSFSTHVNHLNQNK